MTENKYINPNHPVYISYVWENEEYQGIEDDVEGLCKAMEDNGIFYKRDKKNLCPYRWRIQKAEKEIGQGCAIIIFISEKYIKSLHCMHEWHLIRENGKILERVFPIVLEGTNITNKNKYKEYYNFFVNLKEKLIVQQQEGIVPLTQIESESVRHGFYIEDLQKMYQYLSDNNCRTLPIIQNGNYNVIIKQLITHINQICNINSVIDFNLYDKPLTFGNGEKKFFGREAFVNELYKHFFVEHKNCLNIVASGGMGKTSTAHIYIQKHREKYDNIAFVISNNNIVDDFNNTMISILSDDNTKSDIKIRDHITTRQICDILSNISERTSNLLVIDVNIDNNNLASPSFTEIFMRKWHILFLSRQHIIGTIQKELPSFENDFEGAKGLFNSILSNNWSDEQLKSLFQMVFYHPLLIEQLAAFAKKNEVKYNRLHKEIAESRINNPAMNQYSGYSIWYEGKEINIIPYLAKLFDYSQYNEKEKYVLKHFILWGYDYIPLNVIDALLTRQTTPTVQYTLNELVEKVVLSKTDKGYRMHGLLAECLKKQAIDFDYTDYVNNVKMILKSNQKVISGLYSCILSTPLNVLIDYNDIHIYDDWKFLTELAKLKRTDVELSERTYKAKWLKELYNLPGEEIYQQINNKYKNKISICVYLDWLQQQQDYLYNLPQSELNIKGVAFRMKKVKSYNSGEFYIGETTVTQSLWKAVMEEYKPSALLKDNDNYPVGSVSWYDCWDFIIKLNKITKLKFRLPFVQEWKDAANGGDKGYPFKYGGLDKGKELQEYAWLINNHTGGKHPVAQLKPNSLGLYDMIGNVWEWTYELKNNEVVLLGGCWGNNWEQCWSDNVKYFPEYRLSDVGFRLAISFNLKYLSI